MGALPPLPGRYEEEVSLRAAADFAKTLGGLEEGIRERLRELASEMTDHVSAADALGAQLEATKQGADAKAAEVANQADEKVSEIRAEVEAQKGRLEDALTEQQGQFSEPKNAIYSSSTRLSRSEAEPSSK